LGIGRVDGEGQGELEHDLGSHSHNRLR
jgi:hypothetical protein